MGFYKFSNVVQVEHGDHQRTQASGRLGLGRTQESELFRMFVFVCIVGSHQAGVSALVDTRRSSR
jgi:hypothetical protein